MTHQLTKIDEHMQAKEEEHRVITFSGVHVIEPFLKVLSHNNRTLALRQGPQFGGD